METGINIHHVTISTFFFCLLGFVSAFYVRPQVVVFSIHPSDTVTCEGCRVELSCQFPWQQTVGETPDPQLEWQINGTNITKIFSDVEVSNSQGNMRLIIPTAHPRHAGLYRCVVRDGNNSIGCHATPCIPTVTVSREATVQVIGHSVAMVTVNVSRCRPTVLPCGSEILGTGSNRPDVRWFQNGVPVGNTEELLVLSSGDLLLFWSGEDGEGGSGDRGSGDGGVGGRYECVATFSSGTNITMAIFEVELDSEREEPRNDIITAHQTRIEGSAAEMICSLCAKDVTWWKAGDLPNGRRAVSNGTFLISGHVLRLGSLHTRDSGQYCCHGNNTEGTVQQACTQLEVVRTTEPRVTSSQDRNTLFMSMVHSEVENIEIDCSTAETEAQPTTRTWFHNGNKLNVSDTTTALVVSSTGTNASTELYGVYQCFVSNAAGWSGLVTRLLPPYLTNPPGRPSYMELPRPVESSYDAWFQVSWVPPDYTANLTFVQYRVYYLPNSGVTDTPTITTEVLGVAPGRLTSKVAIISPNKEVISEKGPKGRSQQLYPWNYQCANKVLFPPNLSLECEGGRWIVSWTNNSKNAQFYPSTRVGNNVTVGNCSYPNGTVLKINKTFYFGEDSYENDQLLPAGAECSFQGAARPSQGIWEDPYCYRRDLIAYSDPRLCIITAAVSFEQEQYAVNESENVVEVCVITEGYGVAVNLSTLSLTTQAGQDYYIQSPLELTITSVADNRQCVNITILNDGKVEKMESFMIVLQSSDPYVVLNSSAYNATVSIIDNSYVTIGFEKEVYAVHENASTVSVCAVVLEGELERDVKVFVTTQSNNTAAGEDFVRLPQEQTLTFNVTTRRLCVEVEILEDDVVEGFETLFFSLSTSDPAVQIDNAPSAVIIIIDNDDVTIGFEKEVYAEHENASTVSVCAVVLEGELERDVKVFVTTQSNNAAAGEDFVRLPQEQTLTFNATTRRQCVEVEILEDDVIEGNETLFFSLSTSDPAVQIDNAPSAVIIIIDNDDVTIGFEQEVYAVHENANTVSVCAVVLEGELERDVKVFVTTQSNNAAAGEDFVRLPQERTLTFNATTRTRCVEVEILEDDVIEGNETLFFSLSTSDPAVQIDNAPSAVIIIIDNDDVTIGFEKEVYAVHENANTVSVCAVVLEGELERDVKVFVTTQSNNAAAGEDFVRLPQEQTLTFNVTTRRLCVEVEILEDDVIEGNETLFFSLSTSDRAVQIDNAPSAVIIIIDNDDVTIGFEQEVYAVHENANTVSVCAVVLEGELERDVKVFVTTQSNNAAAGEDFARLPQERTLTFNATTRRLCVEVEILEDDVVEGFETLFFSLSTYDPAVQIHNAPSAVIIIIDNDDVTIGFEKEVYAVHENANTVSVCAVVLEGELERDVEMNVTIQSNNIAAGEDFVRLPQERTLTFNATTRTRCVEVEILEDDVIEGNETLFFSLSTYDPAVQIDNAPSAVIIIIDNDVPAPTVEPSAAAATAAVVSVAMVILLSLIATALAVCLWRLKKRDKTRFPFPAYPIDEVVDEHYMPVSLDTHTNDEDTKSIITVYHELYQDKKMSIETASISLNETPRKNSESSSLLPLPFPFHPEAPQTVNEVSDLKHASGRRNSNSSSCSTQHYIHFDKLLDVSGAPPYRNVFQTVNSSFSSVHPIHEEQTTAKGVSQSFDLAAVKTPDGEEDGETDEGIRRHSLSLTSSSRSSCEHIENYPQAETIAEAKADLETASKTDVVISIADSTRGTEGQCAADRHHGTRPEPDSHQAVDLSTHLTSETPSVISEPDSQDGVMTLSPAPEPEELTRFAPISDSGFGELSEDYFTAH